MLSKQARKPASKHATIQAHIRASPAAAASRNTTDTQANATTHVNSTHHGNSISTNSCLHRRGAIAIEIAGAGRTARARTRQSEWPLRQSSGQAVCPNNGGLCAKRVSKRVGPQPRGSAIVLRLPPQAPGGSCIIRSARGLRNTMLQCTSTGS